MGITELLIEHSQARFPEGYGGKDIKGVCITSLDTYASGCIDTYMRYQQKSIDLERYLILQKCKNELEEVLPYIDGEALEYFDRLYKICSGIIAKTRIV